MSQFDYGDIDPATTSGSQLALRLGQQRDALNTMHSGAARPAYAQPGMLWVETDVTPWNVWLFNGNSDVLLGTVGTGAGGTFVAQRQMAANTFAGRLTTAGPMQDLTAAQLQDALVIGDLVGMVAPFAANTVPTGWLKCNGQLVSRSVYARLFAKISTTYGAGNGSTTFALPDLRGDFVRGLDEGAGLDPSRTLGSYQADAIGPHSHQYDRGTPTGGGADGLSTSVTNVTTGATGIKSAGTGIGTETRPKNIAMPFFIKF